MICTDTATLERNSGGLFQDTGLSQAQRLCDRQTLVGGMRHMPWSGLPHWVAGSHRDPGLVRVGVVMKGERQQELCSRSLLPLIPKDGVVFIPLDMHQPLSGQQPFDALLHKVNGHQLHVCSPCDADKTQTALRAPVLKDWANAHQHLSSGHALTCRMMAAYI